MRGERPFRYIPLPLFSQVCKPALVIVAAVHLTCGLKVLTLIATATLPLTARAASWTPLTPPQLAEAPPRQVEILSPSIPPTPAYALSAYVGRSPSGRFTKIFYAPWEKELEDEHLVALAVSARLFNLTEHLSLEVEANVSRRFGNADHWEFAVPLLLRWDGFPWNDVLYTTFALAIMGPSYATEVSASEREKSHNDKGSHWLNYFAPEITVSPPGDRNFSFFARIHHRSGIFGLINGVSGGSSYVSLGVRYRF